MPRDGSNIIITDLILLFIDNKRRMIIIISNDKQEAIKAVTAK